MLRRIVESDSSMPSRTIVDGSANYQAMAEVEMKAYRRARSEPPHSEGRHIEEYRPRQRREGRFPKKGEVLKSLEAILEDVVR